VKIKSENCGKNRSFHSFFVDLKPVQCYNGLIDESVKAKKKKQLEMGEYIKCLLQSF